MATLALCMSPMASELNGTWQLARTWTRAGHRVVYTCVADARAIVEAGGFEPITLLASQLPPGSIEDAGFYYDLERMSAVRRVMAVRRRKRRAERALAELVRRPDNDVARVFQRVRPDLVLIGTHTRHPTCFGLIAARLGIPCAYLTQQMIQATRPAAGAAADAAPPMGLGRRLAARGRQALAATIDYGRCYRALLAGSGLPADRVDYDSPRFPLRAPILYPWPRMFDMPDIEYVGVIRIETGIDPDRREEPLSEPIPRRSGLVFCSFGTMLPIGVAATQALLRTVAESMRPLDDLQMVLAVGPYFRPEDIGSVPPNVQIRQRAPQMAMLKAADLVITHGGSSTVRECLRLGVPMIVVPLGFESDEYARRVAFHRLGEALDYRTLSSAGLTASICAVRGDAEVRRAVARMRQAIDAWDHGTPSLRAIDALLQPAPSGGAQA